MDKDTLIKYAPLILVVLAIIFQYNLFVTPERLEVKHREIVNDISQSYVSKDQYNAQYNDIKRQLDDMNNKVSKIYELLTKGVR